MKSTVQTKTYVRYRVPLLFDGSSDMFREQGLALANGGGRAKRTGRLHDVFDFFWPLLATSLHALAFDGLGFLCFHCALGYTDTLHIVRRKIVLTKIIQNSTRHVLMI